MPTWDPRANDLFLKALALGSRDERLKYLAEACVGDAALRAEVEALLDASEKAGSFLQSPVPLPEPTTAAYSPAPLQAGSLVGLRYKLLEVIGEGGMGSVWMAEQTEPVQRRVAVKLIKPGMDSKQVVNRFEAERQALALMDHPNIAKVFDGGVTPDGRPYFVMELVKGTPITKYCDEKKLNVRERLELFGDVCRAVQHAHQKGIIHRDLKPSNVLVAPYDGRAVVKVIDFGVAKATGQKLTEATLFTGFGAVVGTPEYMSPEQAEVNNQDIDTRSDIYSLGVLLYELLTGSTPLTRKRVKDAAFLELLRVIREEEPPKPSTRLSSTEELPSISAQRQSEPAKLAKLVRGELDWIVMKALEKDRNRRYETANGFAMDVQRYLADEAVQACPPSAGYRLRKFARRNRGRLVAASLVLLALLAGIVGTTFGLIRAESRREDAVRAQAEEADQRRKAENSAIAERIAREQALARLTQIEKGNEILYSVFAELNIRTVKTSGERLEVVLAQKLQKAAEQLDAQSIGDPIVVAKIQNTLGLTLLNLGFASKAIPLFQKAWDARRTELGADHADTFASLNNLATANHLAGQLDTARPLYEQSLALSEKKRGADHPDSLTIMGNLAMCYQAAGRIDKALPLHEKAVKLTTSTLGENHHDTLISMNNLALGYHDAGRLGKAIPLQEETLKRMKVHLKPDHPDTLACMNNLATSYKNIGQPEKALPLQEEALRVMKSRLGADHPTTLAGMNNLALAYRSMGQMQKAASLLEETLEIMRTKSGRDHPDTLGCMNNLGTTHRDAGQLDKALRVLTETLELRKTKLGAQHPDTLTTIAGLGKCHELNGDLPKAIELYEEAALGVERVRFQHPHAQGILSFTASAYETANQFEKAEQWRRKWLAVVKQQPGSESIAYANELEFLGENLLRQKKWADAQAILSECHTTRKKVEPDGWRTFRTQSLLGGALLGLRNYTEAEPLLRDGYVGMKQREPTIPAPEKNRLDEALEFLIQLYSETKKPEELKRWNAEKEARSKSGKK